jgi:hypothetical protein
VLAQPKRRRKANSGGDKDSKGTAGAAKGVDTGGQRDRGHALPLTRQGVRGKRCAVAEWLAVREGERRPAPRGRLRWPPPKREADGEMEREAKARGVPTGD